VLDEIAYDGAACLAGASGDDGPRQATTTSCSFASSARIDTRSVPALDPSAPLRRGGDRPNRRVHVVIVTPWRAAGVPLYVAAGDLGSGVFFNPVPPEDTARALRDA
jgi:hypothetical protein